MMTEHQRQVLHTLERGPQPAGAWMTVNGVRFQILLKHDRWLITNGTSWRYNAPRYPVNEDGICEEVIALAQKGRKRKTGKCGHAHSDQLAWIIEKTAQTYGKRKGKA